LLTREITALSAGEACLVAIAAALVSRPVLLLVDEPLADLDSAARDRVVGVLDRLAHDAGVCVVVAEHNLREWESVADARFELRNATLTPAELLPAPVTTAAPRPAGEPGSPIAKVRHVSVTHGTRVAVDDASLDIAAGEILALRGPNGAGKSSLLDALARPRAVGTVTVGGSDVAGLRPRARRHAIALVPESADDLLFATTVQEECRRAGAGAAALFSDFLGLDGTASLLARHPRDLSAGERLCLVIAIQLSAGPNVLLVDEPTRGLDASARELVGSALSRAAASGVAVVFATHDSDFADRFATRTLAMADGRIAAHEPAVTP